MNKFHNLLEVVSIIKRAKNIVLTTHIIPDGDGIGAILALKEMIFQIDSDKDKKITLMIDDDTPKKLDFLAGSEHLEKYEPLDENEIDLIISLDVSVGFRLGRLYNYKGRIKILNIDHHINAELFGDYNYIDTSAASVTEVVYNLIEELQLPMSKAQAEAIYIGILNDTNNFTYKNTTEKLLFKVKKLVEIGVDQERMFKFFYLSKTPAAIKIYELAKEKAVKIDSLKFIYTFLSLDDIKKAHGNKFDTEGLSDELLKDSYYKFSLFLMEENEKAIRGSMRTSLDDFDLNKIVHIVNGGGHKGAVGFSIMLPKDEIINKIVAELEKYSKLINHE